MKTILIRSGLVAVLAVPVYLAPQAGAFAQNVCASVWRVAPGDTLSRIARACNIPARAIQDANPRVDWSRLQVGMPINLDAPRSGGRPSAAPGGPDRYVVQRGDTIESIARARGLSVAAFRAANPGLSSRDLQPGREIVFGGGQRADRGRDRAPRFADEQRRVEVSIDDRDAVPGGTVVFEVAGVTPNTRVVVATNPGPGLAGTDREASASRRGIAVVELDLPRSARPGQRWTYEVLDEDLRPLASGAYRIGEP